MIFNDKTYKILKWLVLVALPAVGTFYFAVGNVWGLPAPEQVVATLSAIAACLGSLIGISSRNYAANGRPGETVGVLRIDSTDPEKDLYSLELEGDSLDRLPGLDKATFKVDTHV